MGSSAPDGVPNTPPEFRTPLWRTLLRANKQYVAMSAVCVLHRVRVGLTSWLRPYVDAFALVALSAWQCDGVFCEDTER